jgi:hypothetical protein
MRITLLDWADGRASNVDWAKYSFTSPRVIRLRGLSLVTEMRETWEKKLWQRRHCLDLGLSRSNFVSEFRLERPTFRRSFDRKTVENQLFNSNLDERSFNGEVQCLLFTMERQNCDPPKDNENFRWPLSQARWGTCLTFLERFFIHGSTADRNHYVFSPSGDTNFDRYWLKKLIAIPNFFWIICQPLKTLSGFSEPTSSPRFLAPPSDSSGCELCANPSLPVFDFLPFSDSFRFSSS